MDEDFDERITLVSDAQILGDSELRAEPSGRRKTQIAETEIGLEPKNSEVRQTKLAKLRWRVKMDHEHASPPLVSVFLTHAALDVGDRVARMGWLMRERRRIAARREALISAGWEWDGSDSQPIWHRTLYGEDEFSFASVIQGRNVTDAGLAHLASLTQLQELSLDNTHINDAGLVHLTGMTQLQQLYLDGTQTTYSGVTTIQKSLPNCRIIF